MPFQGSNAGSNPAGDTKQNLPPQTRQNAEESRGYGVRISPSAFAPRAVERDSGERRRVEERQVVVDPVHFGPGLLPPAGDIEVVVEQLPADLLDGAMAAGDPARVDVDQVRPALGELGARAH